MRVFSESVAGRAVICQVLFQKNMARINKTIALTTSAVIRVWDLVTAAPAGEAAQPLPPQNCINFNAQMQHGGTGNLGYILLGAKPGYTPNPATNGDLSAEIAPSTSTAPGGSFYQNQSSFGSPLAGTLDLTRTYVAGSTGDSMIVTYDTVS